MEINGKKSQIPKRWNYVKTQENASTPTSFFPCSRSTKLTPCLLEANVTHSAVKQLSAE